MGIGNVVRIRNRIPFIEYSSIVDNSDFNWVIKCQPHKIQFYFKVVCV